MGTGSLPGVRCGRGVTLTYHPLLVPRSKIEQSYTSRTLRAFVAYEMVKPTYICLLAQRWSYKEANLEKLETEAAKVGLI